MRVCLITTGHLSTNPRLVKEADALEEAGYDVRVVATKFWAWAEMADRAFQNRPWSVSTIRFGPVANRGRDVWFRVRQRGIRSLAAHTDPIKLPGALLDRGAHYVTPELGRRATALPAHLYIAHNLGALPAAAAAARRHNARLGFDAEDFHRGELREVPETASQRALVAAVEERYLPHCDYVTAASDGIAEAYAAAVGIERPTTVLNVFPLSERDTHIDDRELQGEVPETGRSLHWFSQTIGPGRGLEDAVRALPHLPEDVVLSLRGGWATGYERELRGLAEALGVGPRLRVLPHCPPNEVVRRAAAHDIGLALEVGETVNRDLCVTNKLFTYLLAGLPAAATATTGQRKVCAAVPEATRLYEVGDVAGLVRAVQDLLNEPRASENARRAGSERYNWDLERAVFLNVVEQTLNEGGKPQAGASANENAQGAH